MAGAARGPLAFRRQLRDVTPVTAAEPPPGTKVLLVDAGLMGRGLARLLAGHGFDVDEAGGGECLRLLDEESAPEIVLLDTGPGWNGLDLLRAIRERWPRDLLP